MKNVNIEYFVEVDSAPPGPEFRHINSERTFDVEFKNGKPFHWDLLEPFQIQYQISKFENNFHSYEKHNDFVKLPAEGSLIIMFEIDFAH